MKKIFSLILALMITSNAWAVLTPGNIPVTATGGSSPTLQNSPLTVSGSTVCLGGTCVSSWGSVPSGVIVMWSGSIASIPTGWVLCNGSNGTPNLTDRFVIAADQSGSYQVGSTGNGSLPATTVTITTTSSLGYGFGVLSVGSGNHYYQPSTGSSPNSVDTLSGSYSFGTGTTNVAVYYALAYIMKT